MIEDCLRKLGYKRIHPIKDFSEIKLGATTRLCTTRSENPVPEFGVVFADSSGVFWNQVDTVVSPTVINFIKSRYSKIDFLLATWQHMMELNYQMNRPMSFPYEEYDKLLNNVGRIRAAALAPGANGFKYAGESSWLNRIVFPITREQFCRDVRQVAPETEHVFTLDPGDTLTFGGGRYRHTPGGCDYVRTVEDDRELLDFAPNNIGHDLIDHNPEGVPEATLRDVVLREIEAGLPEFINGERYAFAEHRRWNVIHQLEVVFPDGRERWSFDFSEERVRPRPGRNPLATFYTSITASSLYGLITRTKSWDYPMLGGYYRRYSKVYAATPLGIVRPAESAPLIDMLELRFPYTPLLENFLQRETEKWAAFYGDAQPQEELAVEKCA